MSSHLRKEAHINCLVMIYKRHVRVSCCFHQHQTASAPRSSSRCAASPRRAPKTSRRSSPSWTTTAAATSRRRSSSQSPLCLHFSFIRHHLQCKVGWAFTLAFISFIPTISKTPVLATLTLPRLFPQIFPPKVLSWRSRPDRQGDQELPERRRRRQRRANRSRW